MDNSVQVMYSGFGGRVCWVGGLVVLYAVCCPAGPFDCSRLVFSCCLSLGFSLAFECPSVLPLLPSACLTIITMIRWWWQWWQSPPLNINLKA